MIDLFGRLPIHERQYITNVVAVPGGGSAYETSAVVVFQGAVGVPSVFQHEVGHAVDAYHNSVQSSSTSTFLNAINADSCVPDDYSNTSKYLHRHIHAYHANRPRQRRGLHPSQRACSL